MEQGSIGEIPQIKFSTSPSIPAVRDDSVMQILNCFEKGITEIIRNGAVSFVFFTVFEMLFIIFSVFFGLTKCDSPYCFVGTD